MEKKKASMNTLTTAIIGAFLLCLAAIGCSRSDNSFDKQLLQTAEEINKNCPIMVDKHTRLDNTLGGPGRRFTYNYTFVNFSADDLDKDEFISRMKLNMVNNIKTNKDMEALRNKNVKMIYVYKSKDQKEFARIVVSPSDYK